MGEPRSPPVAISAPGPVPRRASSWAADFSAASSCLWDGRAARSGRCTWLTPSPGTLVPRRSRRRTACPAPPADAVALRRDVVAATRAEGRTDGEPGEASIDLVSDLRSAPPVRGSAPALREALAGLVQNALDAMPHGGRLTVAARPREGGVELAVVDTGEGIADEARTRGFDPFFPPR